MTDRWVEEYRAEARRLRRLAEASRDAEAEHSYLAKADHYERLALAAQAHAERLRLGPAAPTHHPEHERGADVRVPWPGHGSRIWRRLTS
jgi:hypothetical protein